MSTCQIAEVAERSGSRPRPCALAAAWDGGECGPVQERLQAMVEAKSAEAQDRIAELTTFTAEPRRAAAALNRHRPLRPPPPRMSSLHCSAHRNER